MGSPFIDLLQGQQNAQQSSPQAPPDAGPSAGFDTSSATAPQQAAQSPAPVPTPPSALQSSLPPQGNPTPLKSLLTRFLYGGGQAALKHVGLPTDFDLQQVQFNQGLEQSKLSIDQQRQALAEKAQNYAQTQIPLQLYPGGPVMSVPQSQLGSVLGKQVAGGYGVEKQGVANQGRLNVETAKALISANVVSKLVPNQDGHYTMLSKFGQPLGEVEGSVVPSLLPRTSSTVEYKTQEDGSIVALPKGTTSAPVLPGGRPIAGGGSALPTAAKSRIPAGSTASNVLASKPVVNAQGAPILTKNPASIMERNRADFAQNMSANLDQLDDIVTRRPDLFGKVAGRITNIRSAVGTNDPDIAKLKTIEEFLGQTAMSTHGMRNAQHIAQAANAIVNGFHNSPEATKGSIADARNSLQTFTNNAQSGGKSAGVAAPVPGTLEGGYRFKGGNPADKANWIAVPGTK